MNADPIGGRGSTKPIDDPYAPMARKKESTNLQNRKPIRSQMPFAHHSAQNREPVENFMAPARKVAPPKQAADMPPREIDLTFEPLPREERKVAQNRRTASKPIGSASASSHMNKI